MKNIRLKTYILIVTFLMFLNITGDTAYCNSPPLIMKGNTAFPINNDQIKLESETIKIYYDKYLDESEGRQHEHEVEVIFNFHNTGAAMELDIGFPNTSNYNEKLRNFEAFDYPSMTPYQTYIKDGGVLPEHDTYMYSSMYTWKMHFKENERKSLYVKYRFYAYPEADYILVTGALWKDRIDKVDIYVSFPERAAFPQIEASPANYYYNGEGIEWHFTNIEPDFNLGVRLIQYPSYFVLKDEYYTPRIVNQRKEYKWDERFYWMETYALYAEMSRQPLHQLDDINAIREVVERIKQTNQCVVNEIYARNGYNFQLEKWKNLFEQALWYTPQSDFSYDKLNTMEQFNISYIEKFEETVITDGTDEELIISLKEFSEKYNDKDIIHYRGGISKYHQYTYEFLNREKERIEKIKSMNQHVIVLPDDTNKLEDNVARSLVYKQIVPEKDCYQSLDISQDKKIQLYENGLFVTDGAGNSERIFNYVPYTHEHSDMAHHNRFCFYRTFLFPQITDKITASPNGDYVILGTNYDLDLYSNIVRNGIYTVSTVDGTSYMIGYGNIDDYKIWWSPSETSVCFQHKKEPKVLGILDTKHHSFIKYDLPMDEINDVRITDDNRILLQHKDKIFYICPDYKDSQMKEFLGTLIGVYDDIVYYYKGGAIYKVLPNELQPMKVNDIGHSIWKVKPYKKHLYYLYGGASHLFVCNLKNEKLYDYQDLGYYETLKSSPEGNRIFVYRNHFDFDNGKHIRQAFVKCADTGKVLLVEGGDGEIEWMDNEHLLIKDYAKDDSFTQYRYNPSSNERKPVSSKINKFTSHLIENNVIKKNVTHAGEQRTIKANGFQTISEQFQQEDRNNEQATLKVEDSSETTGKDAPIKQLQTDENIKGVKNIAFFRVAILLVLIAGGGILGFVILKRK